MPSVHNPTDQDLYCDAAGTIVPARGAVAVSAQVAALVPTHVFEIRDDPAPAEEVASEPVAIDEPVAVIDPVEEVLLAAAKQIEADQAASQGA